MSVDTQELIEEVQRLQARVNELELASMNPPTSDVRAPEGWKLVPVELTPEMQRVAVDDAVATRDGGPWAPNFWRAALRVAPEAPTNCGSDMPEPCGHYLYYFPSVWGGYTVRLEDGYYNGHRPVASQPLYTRKSENPKLEPVKGTHPESYDAKASDVPARGPSVCAMEQGVEADMWGCPECNYFARRDSKPPCCKPQPGGPSNG